MHCAFSPEVYLRKKWWALLLSVIGLAGLVLGIVGEDELIVMAAAVLFVVPLCRGGHCLIYRKKDYIELQPQCVTVFQLRDSWIKTDYLRIDIRRVSDLRITPERITVAGVCDAYLYRRGMAQPQRVPTPVSQIDFMRYFDHDAAICEKLENMRKEYGYGG